VAPPPFAGGALFGGGASGACASALLAGVLPVGQAAPSTALHPLVWQQWLAAAAAAALARPGSPGVPALSGSPPVGPYGGPLAGAAFHRLHLGHAPTLFRPIPRHATAAGASLLKSASSPELGLWDEDGALRSPRGDYAGLPGLRDASSGRLSAMASIDEGEGRPE